MKKIREMLTTKKFYEVTFIAIVLMSFVIWLSLIFIEGNVSEQFSIFFNKCGDFLADTLNVVGYSSQRDAYENTMYTGVWEKAYPPLTYMLMYLLSRLVDMNTYYDMDYFLYMYFEPKFLIIFMICLFICLIAMYEAIRHNKTGSNTIKIFAAFAIILSAPILFTIERANTILPTLFFVIFYMFNYNSKNKILKELALISLAIATAFKITPAILGILLLYNRQWKDALRAVLYGLLIGLLPFLFLEGGFDNLFLMIRNIKLNNLVYTSDEGCTLLACLVDFGVDSTDVLTAVMKYLTYLICALLFVFAYIYKEKWMTMMAVCMILIILPSHSGYYSIIYVIPALITFLNQETHRARDIIILFAFLLIFQNVQGWMRDYLFNYHLAIIIIVLFLLIEGVIRLRDVLKGKRMSKKEILQENA